MKYALIFIGIAILVLAAVIGYGTYNESDDVYPHGTMMGGNYDYNREGGDLTKLLDDTVPLVKPTEVVELKDGDTFDLTASIVKREVGNRMIKRLAYNGQIPGPIIKVEKGAKVTVNFKNEIDMETALHSHGLRGDYRFDGATPLSQKPIPVGETFTYELEFPDAGIYWYHPHVREDYQQELGLYGNMVVTELGYWNEVGQEEYLILDDFLKGGEFSSESVTHTMMGRFGNTLLINDRSDYSLEVEKGKVTRLYLTNVANTRTFDVTLLGAEVKLVGGDNGRIEHEKMVDDVIIAPAERYVLEVLYSKAGTYQIVHQGKKIGTVIVRDGGDGEIVPFEKLRSNDDYLTIRQSMSDWLSKDPDKKLRLDIEVAGDMVGMMTASDDEHGDDAMREHCRMMPDMPGCESYLEDDDHSGGHNDGIEWEDNMLMMNSMSTDKNTKWVIEDQETGKKNSDISWNFEAGQMVKVSIYNDEKGLHPMQHPIHFHGQRFVVLAVDGKANDNLQWKDTVLIPKGQTVDILVDMSNKGEWLAHCHIAEHMHAGMMFDLIVE
ncbi:MAG: multicopper oxidase family protein [Candidatus Nomurabacteria bacterium]|nr:MAG: multicopper oxidase family protein [Candidatus Nomurabacteria bacterium]